MTLRGATYRSEPRLFIYISIDHFISRVVHINYSRLLQCERPSSEIVFSVIRVYGVPTSFGVKKAILPFQ